MIAALFMLLFVVFVMCKEFKDPLWRKLYSHYPSSQQKFSLFSVTKLRLWNDGGKHHLISGAHVKIEKNGIYIGFLFSMYPLKPVFIPWESIEYKGEVNLGFAKYRLFFFLVLDLYIKDIELHIGLPYSYLKKIKKFNKITC